MIDGILEIFYGTITPNLQIFSHSAELYGFMKENKDFGAKRKYESTRSSIQVKAPPITKKTGFLDMTLKMSISPGPANQSNIIAQWKNSPSAVVKHPDRKTFVDQIQEMSKRKKMPSPSQYTIDMAWPKKMAKSGNFSEKINLFNSAEYSSALTPGVGSYIVNTKIARKVKHNKVTQNHSRIPIENKQADMTTYDPIPSEYSTFKKYENSKKGNNQNPSKTEIRKKNKENYPGPGAYQIIHTWKKEKDSDKENSCYLDKITKKSSPSIYYH